jgi:hypothetical protein
VSNVFQLPGALLEEPPTAGSLNLTQAEIVDACGGYVRAAEQLRELHARGFVRAYIAKVGRKHVVLERAHYDAVTRGQFGAPAAPAANDAGAGHTPLAPNRAGFRAKFGAKKRM